MYDSEKMEELLDTILDSEDPHAVEQAQLVASILVLLRGWEYVKGTDPELYNRMKAFSREMHGMRNVSVVDWDQDEVEQS